MEKKHPKLDCYVTIDGMIRRVNSDIYTPCNKYKTGYHQASFRNEVEGKRQNASVHRLVWECFVGEIPSGMQINHKDGNKSNNHLSNLEVVTPRQNMQHAVATGLKPGSPGQSNSMSKLTDEQYYQLIDELVHGATNDDIAEKYGLHPRYVSLIRHRKRIPTIWAKYTRNTGIKSAPKSTGLLSKISMETRLSIISQLATKTNQELARVINVDCSVISNVRHKKAWLDAWEIFEEGATTIPKGSRP